MLGCRRTAVQEISNTTLPALPLLIAAIASS
jgi:hypothetical protein